MIITSSYVLSAVPPNSMWYIEPTDDMIIKYPFQGFTDKAF